MKVGILLAVLITFLAATVCSAAEYTYVDLVNRLINMETLSVLPAECEVSGQWSSYDRASDIKDGKFINWDANADWDGHIRKEGDDIVVAEMDGPGCIWRIWSAMPEEGHIKIYLDGAEEPVVDIPFRAMFDHSTEPFTYESLVHTLAQGKNNYVPIPYQKSCKVTLSPGWGRYYLIDYTTFPKDTKVPTFTQELDFEEKAALERVDSYLTNGLGSAPARWPGEKMLAKDVNLKSGESVAVADFTGPSTITSIWVTPDEGSTDWKTLRSTLLRITWDDEESPSVLVPIGDFFGTAPGVNFYKSLPLGMTENGFYSYWYMPFAKRAVVELINEGNKDFGASVFLTTAPLNLPIDNLGRFHAKWHRDQFLPKAPELWIDWPLLITEGRGRFVGVMLEVWNPKGGWWGEGDEKFYVDGEEFPSWFGTGSEDYFGYAWCNPTLFQNAYHNQTISEGNAGHISVNRWHITDNVPFQQSFKGYIEKYFPNDRPTLYAATAYWYQAPGGNDPYGHIPVEKRLNWYTSGSIFAIEGAIEGEGMRLLKISDGDVGPQDLLVYGQGWSKGRHIWWSNAKPGSTLTFGLPVSNSGKYELMIQLTKAIDYGIVQLYLDGEKIGEPIDLYDQNVVPTELISFGKHKLQKGEHELKVEIIGANEKAKKGYMFGLDAVLLKPVK